MRFDNDYPVKALPVAQLLDLPIWGDAEMLAAAAPQFHGCCPNGQHVCCCGLCGDDR
jgi:hypothetical protein